MAKLTQGKMLRRLVLTVSELSYSLYLLSHSKSKKHETLRPPRRLFTG
jgi:hypothetical protein